MPTNYDFKNDNYNLLRNRANKALRIMTFSKIRLYFPKGLQWLFDKKMVDCEPME